MTLGEIGNVTMCKRIFKSQTASQGEVPFYKIGTFGKDPDAYISSETYEDYTKRYPFPSMGDVLISASGTIGRTVAYDGRPAYFQDSNIMWVANDESKVLNRFLFHYYGVLKWNVSSGGTISRLYLHDVAKTLVPVPSLKEQQRIVDILDRFYTLVNDVSAGLPAEIGARRKQYAYYRDRLFAFKDKVA